MTEDQRDFAPDPPLPLWAVVLFLAISIALFAVMVSVGAF